MVATSKKSFLVLVLLSMFVGGLGIDRFYIGRIGTGILKMLTFGGLGIWWIIDLVIIVTGNMRDGSGALVRDTDIRTRR